MPPKRWLLAFAFVAVLALLILYLTNNGTKPPRPVPQLQTSSSTPKVASPRPSEIAKPAPPPPTAKFGVPIFAGNPGSPGNAGNQLVRVVRPQYTEAALNAHYEGEVKVNFILRKDGRAHNIEIVNSPGYGLDQNIIDAVKDWLWYRSQVDQKLTITLVFKLDH